MGLTFAIADLHGRLDILEAALETIEARANGGTIVFLGDYVDRGPDSAGVIRRLMRGPCEADWKWICLKGNHEDMLVYGMRGFDIDTWLGNGGHATLHSFGGAISADILGWIDRLPLYHRDRHRLFVHGGIDPTVPLAQQRETILLWQRTQWDFDYDYPEGYVVHGHTPWPQCPIVLEGRANLDTAAYDTGRLAIAVFDDDIAGKPLELIMIRQEAA